MIYAFGVYSVLLSLGVYALWDRRKDMATARFFVLVLLAPITETLVLLMAFPDIYYRQIRGTDNRLSQNDSIAKHQHLRKHLGGLRIIK